MSFDFLFTGEDLTEKAITVAGETHTVFVKKVPAVQLRAFVDDLQSPDRDSRLYAGYRQLVMAIRDENGNPVMNYEQAKKLSSESAKELIRVFTEVNKVSDADAGNV